MFTEFGEISSAKVSKTADNNSNGFSWNSNGYGFVNFKDKDDAKAVIEKFKDNKEYSVQPFMQTHKKNSTSNNLYVRNFPTTWGEVELRAMFEGFGELGSIKIIMGEDGQSKGFGFVCFKNQADACKAALELNESKIEGEEDVLYVQNAQKKKDRQKALQKAMSR